MISGVYRGERYGCGCDIVFDGPLAVEECPAHGQSIIWRLDTSGSTEFGYSGIDLRPTDTEDET